MKLRLFGLAASWILAGTLCAAAQDLGDPGSGSKAAERSSGEQPKGEGRQGRSEGSSASKQRGSADERGSTSDRARSAGRHSDSDRASDRKDGKSSAQKGNDESNRKNASRDKDKDTDRSAAKKSGDDDRGDGRRAGRESNRSEDANGKRPSRSDTADDARDRDRSKREAADKGADQKGKNVQVSGEKRDRVQSAFRSETNLKRVTDVDIDIRVGVSAPRDWAFAPVPAAVIEVVPEYRGYLVAYVEDEYIICDPDTYEIVAVLPASGGSQHASRSGGGAAAGTCSEVTLSDDDRTAVLRSVQISNEADVSGVTIGWSVPGDIELQTFPNTVVERVGELEACRYFIVDDQIAIVDPDEEKVVLLIETD